MILTNHMVGFGSGRSAVIGTSSFICQVVTSRKHPFSSNFVTCIFSEKRGKGLVCCAEHVSGLTRDQHFEVHDYCIGELDRFGDSKVAAPEQSLSTLVQGVEEVLSSATRSGLIAGCAWDRGILNQARGDKHAKQKEPTRQFAPPPPRSGASVYFAVASQNPPVALDTGTLSSMAFSILITFLEEEGPDRFLRALDSLWIGFRNEGPVISELWSMQKEAGLCGCVKLSEIAAVSQLKEKVELFREILTPQDAEMLLQGEILQVAEEVATRIL